MALAILQKLFLDINVICANGWTLSLISQASDTDLAQRSTRLYVQSTLKKVWREAYRAFQMRKCD